MTSSSSSSSSASFKDLIRSLLEAENGKSKHFNLQKTGDGTTQQQQQQQQQQSPLTTKERNNIYQRSKAPFSQVLEHPTFQANPLATIREHLTNTLMQSTPHNNNNNNNSNNKKTNKKSKK
eukprot:TRINITY_DN7031_c0_g1_i3.p1 TRINITY_DN7031_c0_g1~~TRINITY_DN7031_c0_g1_i3.p1  ORF type:complete len:121 (-),score=55.61 TRINITY_DN7031_c0_g1_i3:249-611(-)